MSSYESIFDARGDLYNAATRLCPAARANERELLMKRLAVQPHHRVCDAPAGGGYLADGLVALVPPQNILCIEPSREFIDGVQRAFRRVSAHLEALSLATCSVDRFASLAGMHHLESKDAFLAEAFRVLVPGGRIAIADVMKGTPVAAFLNGSVDRFTETGHRGIFLDEGEARALLDAAGFEELEETHEHYTWDFPDLEKLVRYCRLLFGMVKADEDRVYEEIQRYLGLDVSRSGARLSWSLVYASGRKRHEPGQERCDPVPCQ